MRKVRVLGHQTQGPALAQRRRDSALLILNAGRCDFGPRRVLVYWVKATLRIQLVGITLVAVAAAWFWAIAPMTASLLYIHPSDWTDADLVRHLWHFRIIQPEWVGSPPQYDYLRWTQAEALARLCAVFVSWLVSASWVIRRHTPGRTAELAEYQQRRDRKHVKLLAIFHFVFGGLALGGIAFLFVHYSIMHTVFSNPDMWKSQQQAMPPKEFLDAFVWFYLFMGVLLLTGLALNVLSGLFLLQKRNRLFSVIIGGLNCLQIPFGTALGVFTILVLSRDSVRQLYAGRTEST